ncbi:helix-turn-helix transcriptional regulator [Halorussus sp. MSC15.2]|uniref:helix-turn-helix transcriptional regulator n=1 Tax=Halorussus sp. MSC15.2 TaxID=2283638 RepID=UPI0013D56087|nr:helix-turn-helix transcriptional regulator [Halorussus sp. MSC15.2]NEU59240.1 hypothetical protein [Halorussus sp. MSC15.2]
MLSRRRRIASDLTSYKRDLLWAVHRANHTEEKETPVGADVKRELEALGQTNTEGGQFYPRLNELVDSGLATKDDHPNDARGFTVELTEDGKAILSELVLRTAESLDMDVPECALPSSDVRPRTRGET